MRSRAVACESRRVRRPKVRVVLGKPDDQAADLVVQPARRASFREPRTVLVAAPRWDLPGGSEVALANAYRAAIAAANERGARTLVLPAALVRGIWPIDDLIRVAMTVLMSTPSSLEVVTIAAPTPALLEAWVEAILHEPSPGR